MQECRKKGGVRKAEGKSLCGEKKGEGREFTNDPKGQKKKGVNLGGWWWIQKRISDLIQKGGRGVLKFFGQGGTAYPDARTRGRTKSRRETPQRGGKRQLPGLFAGEREKKIQKREPRTPRKEP